LYTIENATWRDLGELRTLEAECFGKDAWPLLDLIGVLTLPGNVRIKAVTPEGKMAGFIAGDPHPAEKLGWITTLGVRVAYRKQGMAASLLSECEEYMRMRFVRLCVRSNNEPALHLYERAGYSRVTVWKGYYIDGQDALVLEKDRGV
jgi:ribosomal protein S18 acetylase RimI-like enzyme